MEVRRMYYVNKAQIEQRLQFIPLIVKAMNELNRDKKVDLLSALAQERVLHLAIESVTDIGSYMIDGLMMREASSYEDIIEVLHDEKVFAADTKDVLMQLVKLRRPLVQEYFSFPREQLHPLISILPEVLSTFAEKANLCIEQELGVFDNEGS
jgi:uncharacterized protein YutE (UPF0331/DUF86 family)